MPIPDLHGLPVLVTGGAGFIGSHLVDALVEGGARVRVLDDLSTGRRDNLAHLGERIELVAGDIRDYAACRAACEGVALVFHQAALGSVPRSIRDPASTIAVNVTGTANVFAAAREAGVRRVVYASSSSVYGDSARLPKREGEEGEALSPYAASKRMCEELGRVFHRSLGLETVGLRYFNVYGPRQDPAGPYAAVVPLFFAAALAAEPATIHGDGEQSRDFTFVADAVAANLVAAGAPAEDAAGQAFNVAAGGRTSINHLARLIGRAVGGAPEPRHVEGRAGDVRHSQASLGRARRALGYEPAWPIERGLAQTLDWYRREAPVAAG
jgi:UDP-N-acetylglucosamine/UDP-N-acetylgalactosamine 4-epimerase